VADNFVFTEEEVTRAAALLDEIERRRQARQATLEEKARLMADRFGLNYAACLKVLTAQAARENGAGGEQPGEGADEAQRARAVRLGVNPDEFVKRQRALAEKAGAK